MQYIPMNILEYQFDEEGITQRIVIAFQHWQGDEHFNARVSLTDAYVKGINPKLALDTLNKEQIENFARRKMRDWVMVSRPEPEAETGE